MEIIKLPCNHSFIPDAIEKWLKEENAICPICRYTLDSKEVENPQHNIQTSSQNLLQSIRRTYAPSLLNTIYTTTSNSCSISR